jgi:hypothetical protein
MFARPIFFLKKIMFSAPLLQQTGSTINHLSQIFFVLAAPMYWRKGECHGNGISPNRQVYDYSLG